jgi:hypothetical protein
MGYSKSKSLLAEIVGPSENDTRTAGGDDTDSTLDVGMKPHCTKETNNNHDRNDKKQMDENTECMLPLQETIEMNGHELGLNSAMIVSAEGFEPTQLSSRSNLFKVLVP